MAAPGFRINAQRFLLTYPQATIDIDDYISFLNTLDIKPKRAVVTRELHQDGNEHLHAAVEFERRVNSTRVSIFDYNGHHPNISAARSWAACVNYCRKEGALETSYFGCEAENATVAGTSVQASRATGAESFAVAEQSDTIREWYEYCIDNNISFAFANAIWNHLHAVPAPTFYTNTADGAITSFELIARQWSDEYRTLVLCGPSGCGKTTWALKNAPTPFLLVTDIDDLGAYDPGVHQCIVFDEIRCTGDPATGRGAWPLTSQIKLVTWDTPVSIRIRYKIAHLPWHVKKIFTSTTHLPFSGDEQIRRRIHVVNCYTDRSVDDLYLHN